MFTAEKFFKHLWAIFAAKDEDRAHAGLRQDRRLIVLQSFDVKPALL